VPEFKVLTNACVKQKAEESWQPQVWFMERLALQMSLTAPWSLGRFPSAKTRLINTDSSSFARV
jgi:hypothetical protein